VPLLAAMIGVPMGAAISCPRSNSPPRGPNPEVHRPVTGTTQPAGALLKQTEAVAVAVVEVA
jgi:hypothetical protein